jgi:pyrroloquinoline quinone biosynthesis protein B
MRVIVLGSAAGGGFPQWNCRCPVCTLAWQGDSRVCRRSQSSLAVSADGISWLLLNASPDLRQQILATPALHPRQGQRDSPIAGVFLTNGDIDHIAGLLNLREGQRFTIFATLPILDLLQRDAVFAVLDPSFVGRQPVEIGRATPALPGVAVTAFLVPGKVPLFLEGEHVELGLESEMTIGLEITAGGKRMLYIPGCAALPGALLDRLAGADLLFFDGTTFTDDEMPRLGLSPKTAARMGHLAMSGPGGSLAGLAGTRIGRKIYIHINNTNPVLIEGSPERLAVEAAGWDIGTDGMEIAL